MIIEIPDILSTEQIAHARRRLESADWEDGKKTAGHQAVQTKNNQQLPTQHPVAKEVGQLILSALSSNPLFLTAALPKEILPPMFNLYTGNESFGTHVDNAIRTLPDGRRIRTDLSCTLFFAEPDEYEGGELIIEDTYGSKEVKLPAGHLILYPSTSLHQVTPVTKGARLCSFFWIQSMVRSDEQRSLLFDLDISIQRLAQAGPDNQAVNDSTVQLTGVYHNLLRQWAEM
ncbi:MAG: Fe2+-dependent dioxygenase [Verrucomicrobiota bacterium JB023]|nr:Fe2+-dependent dioxygenase [Verrucomicrobiota bacterium JB023]